MCCSPYRDTRGLCIRGCGNDAEFGALCEHCYAAIEEAISEERSERELNREVNEYHPPMPRG